MSRLKVQLRCHDCSKSVLVDADAFIETLIGGTGPGDDTIQFPKVLAGVLGAKLKIIAGYPGGHDAVLAMERGELQGRCGWAYSSIKAPHPGLLAQKKGAILVEVPLAQHP